MHEMNLQSNPFKSIKQGTKTIEMRLYDEKRKSIKVGDIITFTNAITNEKIFVKVLKLHLFKSFKELYEAFDKVSLGYDEEDTPDYNDMQQYYKDEDMKKYGVVGIEICLI